jgi:rubredoxin
MLEISETLTGETAQCSGCRGLVVVPGKPRSSIGIAGGSPLATTSTFRCPFCGSSSLPVVRKKVSVAGWAVFIALLFVCFLFAPFALFIREDRRYCGDCRIELK